MRSTVVLLPVKRLALAKSRLSAPSDGVRRELALAFATDTLTTALASEVVDRLVVVTDEPALISLATKRGCEVHRDARTLNEALRDAALAQPRATRLVALCADLPALRTSELTTALRMAGEGPAFVADSAATGTTLYAAARDVFAPRFGPASASRHRAAGAAEIAGPLPGLRLDVDDADALRAAQALGLGSATTELLARLS